MNKKIELLRQLQEWIKRTPENEVRAALAIEGVGDTTIRDLLRGTYDSEPRPLLQAAMARVLASKAS